MKPNKLAILSNQDIRLSTSSSDPKDKFNWVYIEEVFFNLDNVVSIKPIQMSNNAFSFEIIFMNDSACLIGAFYTEEEALSKIRSLLDGILKTD